MLETKVFVIFINDRITLLFCLPYMWYYMNASLWVFYNLLWWLYLVALWMRRRRTSYREGINNNFESRWLWEQPFKGTERKILRWILLRYIKASLMDFKVIMMLTFVGSVFIMYIDSGKGSFYYLYYFQCCYEIVRETIQDGSNLLYTICT